MELFTTRQPVWNTNPTAALCRNTESRIVHLLASGIGLEFSRISPMSYGHLVYLMARNAPEPDALFDELARNPVRLSDSV